MTINGFENVCFINDEYQSITENLLSVLEKRYADLGTDYDSHSAVVNEDESLQIEDDLIKGFTALVEKAFKYRQVIDL